MGKESDKKWRDLGLFDAGGEVWDCVVADESCEAQGGEKRAFARGQTHGGPGTQASCLPPRRPRAVQRHSKAEWEGGRAGEGESGSGLVSGGGGGGPQLGEGLQEGEQDPRTEQRQRLEEAVALEPRSEVFKEEEEVKEM